MSETSTKSAMTDGHQHEVDIKIKNQQLCLHEKISIVDTLLMSNLTNIGSILIERYINISEKFYSPFHTMCQIEALMCMCMNL